MWLKGEGGVRAPLEMDSGQVVPVFVVKQARERAKPRMGCPTWPPPCAVLALPLPGLPAWA
eukprot:scaffold4659_cov125-Isochrysis_galbana.AAC.17